MKDSEICMEAIREYLIKPLDDGFEKESVDLAYYGTVKDLGPEPVREVVMVEGKCKIFGRYKAWIDIDIYREIARDYKLRNLI
jgi:hypothetical protein